MIEVHPQQAAFLASDSMLTLFCGGVGSGKSWAGALWMRDRCLRHPNGLHLIGANTYLQLHKSTLVQFFKILDAHGPSYCFNRKPPDNWRLPSRFKNHDNVTTLRNGAQILTYSLDNYDVMRGLELADAWLDETRDTHPDAFDVLLSRLRGHETHCPGIQYQIKITTTPNGYDWLWERFESPEKLPETQTIFASSYDNLFLPETYASGLEAKLGKRLAQQEIHAQFVSLAEGRAFDFDRKIHMTKQAAFEPDIPVLFSMDFNVSPLCGIVMQYDLGSREAWVIDEIHIPDNAKTVEACREFVRRYKGKAAQVEFEGDIAGRARDTRGTPTDHSLMRQEIEGAFEFSRWSGDNRQRPVMDGINAVNALLAPAMGKTRLKVHPKCKYLIRDLEQVSIKPGTREIDKSKKQLTHMTDALRYPIARLFPVARQKLGGWHEQDAEVA